MTIDELNARREQVQVALQQNHFTMQGHLNEIDFQIAELAKAKEAEIAQAKIDEHATMDNHNPNDNPDNSHQTAVISD